MWQTSITSRRDIRMRRLLTLDQPDRAEELYRGALQIYKNALGEESREHVEGLFHFSCFFTRQERFSEAAKVVSDLLRLAEREIDVADLEKADYFEVAAVVFEKLGKVERSEELRARAERIFQKNQED
jgi:tetratricopeptide (TPR) repeat protein